MPFLVPLFTFIVVVQPLSCVRLFVTAWTAVCQVPLYSTVSCGLLKFMSIKSVMLSNYLILCCPLLLLPSIFPSIRIFSNDSGFAWGGQSIRDSASATILPMNIQSWFPLGWTGWISLQSKGLSRVFSHTTVQKHQFFSIPPFFMVRLSHPYMTTGKTIALRIWAFVRKIMSLLLNMLCRSFQEAFLPRSKCLLISWLQLPSLLILEPKKIKSVTASTFSSSICYERLGLDAMILDFWMLNFKSAFSLYSFSSLQEAL